MMSKQSRQQRGILLVFLILLAVAVSACGNQPASEQAKATVWAVLDEEKVMKAHPKYLEWQSKKTAWLAGRQKLEWLKQSLVLQAAHDVQTLAMPAMPAVAQATQSLQEVALQQQLQERAKSLRKELDQEMKAYGEDVHRELDPEVVSLQLKLRIVSLQPQEAEALRLQLTQVQQLQQRRLAQKEAELAQRFAAALAPLREAIRQEQTVIRPTPVVKVESPSISKITPENLSLERIRELEEKLQQQELEWRELQRLIQEEVQDRAGRIASARGVDIVLRKPIAVMQAVDITEWVAQALQHP
ncbi:hypothetical protein [Anaeromusa sp.]|uniref:hypothetical protein n=1 Tax=Anaeromusa sp. TaxID=1872520 RepID=UPI002601EC94|nr:hypothetical protein [Anaeromusa sp.]MDD3157258.1 hypothetical protein [Anaeromusa sp.]